MRLTPQKLSAEQKNRTSADGASGCGQKMNGCIDEGDDLCIRRFLQLQFCLAWVVCIQLIVYASVLHASIQGAPDRPATPSSQQLSRYCEARKS